jgi:hypothetical protein
MQNEIKIFNEGYLDDAIFTHIGERMHYEYGLSRNKNIEVIKSNGFKGVYGNLMREDASAIGIVDNDKAENHQDDISKFESCYNCPAFDIRFMIGNNNHKYLIIIKSAM